MNGTRVGRILALGAALLVGCNGGEDAPSNPTPPPSTPAPTTPDVTPKADAADSGAGGVGAATTDPTAGDAGAATTTTPDPKAAGAAAAEQDEAASKTKEAQEHLAATIKHLKDNNPDLARASLRKAEALRDGLPTAVREEIKTVRANVDKSAKSEALPPPTGDDENK